MQAKVWRDMCAQGLLNATYIRYLFEVAVHPLIDGTGNATPLFDVTSMVLVFFRNHPWYIQCRGMLHILFVFRAASLSNSPRCCLVWYAWCQMLRIRERQATQRTKDKNITDGFKVCCISNFLLMMALSSSSVKKSRLPVLRKRISEKRVIGNPFADQSKPGDFFQVFQVLDRCILSTILPHLYKVFKVLDEFMVQLLQRNIFQIVLAFEAFLPNRQSFHTSNQCLHIITVYKFPILLVRCFTEYSRAS